MIETNITLLNINIWICYQIFDDNYIDWQIVSTNKTGDDDDDDQIENCLILLATVLRANHTTYIESVIREHYHWHMEEQYRMHPSEPHTPY